MAVDTTRDPVTGRIRRLEPGLVERRVFVQAAPRVVWASLHDPANAVALFPQLRFGVAAPDWPAAASTRPVGTRLGLLRDDAWLESLEARPQARFRMRLNGSGFRGEWTWRLEPLAGGTRVVHAARFDPLDRWAGLLVRLGGGSLEDRVEEHLRVLKERAERAAGPRPASD